MLVKSCFSAGFRCSAYLWPGLALLLATTICMPPAVALEVTGQVVDGDGKPVSHVRVRFVSDKTVPYSTSVFSGADGFFAASIPDKNLAEVELDFFRIGWSQVNVEVSSEDGDVAINAVLHAIDNVAEQVPSSAWLQGDPDSTAYHMTTLQCSNCHQLGAERVRNFSAKLAAQPAENRSDAWLERSVEDLSYDGKRGAWRENVSTPAKEKIEAWDSMVQFMRLVTLRLGEENKLRWGLEEGSDFYNALLQPETSLFVPRDMEIVVPNLARNFPVDFGSYTDFDDVERLGDYGSGAGTIIEEYVLPTFGWTREIAIAPGSSMIWFLETDKDRLGALNPIDGSVEWFDVPGIGQQGPHTMNADAQGNLWVALEDSFYIARFSTKSKEWRMYPPPPGKVFGVTHDFAYNSDRHVEPDSGGRIWITDLGMNELWGIHVESGDISTYTMPIAVGESNFHSLLYGAAYDRDRDRVWWAQLHGYVGSFDPVNNLVERIVPFDRGAGPRRLAIQDDGILWIPLYGSSDLVKFDSIKGLEIGRFSIPDPGAGPYGVTLDKKRNAIWAATSNSDRIYRFNIGTETWQQYPMPRKETFIRMIEVDAETGDVWTTYSSLPVGKRDAAVFGTESANNIIVRLRPGD
jgi:streptogramin lyase